MYDKSGAGILLRKYTGVSMAWWHSYKWATKRVMEVFGKDFIGPMFHHMFSDKEYNVNKMSHTARVTYLSYIRLAYPLFKEALEEALLKRNLTTRQKTVLQNLSDLCEYFIPVVLLLLLPTFLSFTMRTHDTNCLCLCVLDIYLFKFF